MNPPPLRILFLPRWYPHRYDPMPGLFIQRQAEALSALCEVIVLYVHADPDCPNMFETEYGREHGVEVIRVYYRPGATALSRWRNFMHAHERGLDLIKGTPPDLVHAHILTREGLMAYRIAHRFRVPYVVSEHWSRYFAENGTYRGALRRKATEFAVNKASAVIAVSENLKRAMIAAGLPHPRYRVIPNVVDTDLFRPDLAVSREEKKIIMHISCFDDKSKDISGFLEAVRLLLQKRSDFECHLVGEGPDHEAMQEVAQKLGLKSPAVFFDGMQEGEKLVRLINQADFTVLSSRYETFGTVVVESLACGVPVVATDTGIVPEVLNAKNGLIVPPGDPVGLADAMDRMLELCRTLDRTATRSSVTDRFSNKEVSGQLLEVYHEILGGTNV